MVLREFNVGVVGCNLVYHFVPEGHRVDDAVRLRCGGDLARAGAGQIEGVACYPLDSDPGEHCLLYGHLVGAPLEHPPPDLGVLTLGVLSDDDDVELVPTCGQGTLHSVKQPDGSQRDVLIEAAPNRNEQAPERNVVGDVGSPDGPQQDCIGA